METKIGVDGKGEEKVADDEEKSKGQSTEVVDVDARKVDNLGDEKKVDVGQDTKKPGDEPINPPNHGTPTAITDDTTKPITDVKEVNPTIKEEKAEPTDEGDVATPKRVTKDLPASPGKSLREKLAPTLGLVVPKSPEKGSDLPAATILSPLQRAIQSAEDETLMERMARLEIGDANYQPPKDTTPAPHTDLESDFECETAPSGPSTPRSRAGRGNFNFMLRSDVPLSDDDELFLDCDTTASVSNFDGV